MVVIEDVLNLQFFFKALGRRGSAKGKGRKGQWTEEKLRRRDFEREGGTSSPEQRKILQFTEMSSLRWQFLQLLLWPRASAWFLLWFPKVPVLERRGITKPLVST